MGVEGDRKWLFLFSSFSAQQIYTKHTLLANIYNHSYSPVISDESVSVHYLHLLARIGNTSVS